MGEVSVPSECPCGRVHYRPRKTRRKPGLADHSDLSASIYDALAEGKATQGSRLGEWDVNYARDCLAPITMKRSSSRGALFATYAVRCRKCEPCLRAKMHFWAYAAIRNIGEEWTKEGSRTWFGTFTLSPQAQEITLQIAVDAFMASHHSGEVPEWLNEPSCDYRFELHRNVLLREMQLYWKRQRKAGLQFKYLLAFERHKSGLPHIHALIHEKGTPIRLHQLQERWQLGFTKFILLGGKAAAKRGVKNPERAGYYVCKYLQKHSQSRQLASIGYSSNPLKG